SLIPECEFWIWHTGLVGHSQQPPSNTLSHTFTLMNTTPRHEKQNLSNGPITSPKEAENEDDMKHEEMEKDKLKKLVIEEIMKEAHKIVKDEIYDDNQEDVRQNSMFQSSNFYILKVVNGQKEKNIYSILV